MASYCYGLSGSILSVVTRIGIGFSWETLITFPQLSNIGRHMGLLRSSRRASGPIFGWSPSRAKEVSYFLWLSIHRGIPGIQWVVGYSRCADLHCVWDAMMVWKTHVFILFSYITSKSFTMTWGAALWSRGFGAFALFGSGARDHAFFVQRHLRWGPTHHSNMDPQDLFLVPIPAQDTLPSSQLGRWSPILLYGGFGVRDVHIS